MTDAPEWCWIDAGRAAELALLQTPTLEALRQGHGLLAPDAFVRSLETSELEVLLLPGQFAALVTWGACEDGLTLNVLTVTGELENAKEAFLALEAAARHSEARQILSVGHPGWKRLVESIGYETHTRLCMRKLLA